MQTDAEDFKVPVGKKISLDDYDPAWIPKWAKEKECKEDKKTIKDEAAVILEANRQKLIEMQELLWASDSYSMLIILQGMDAAGKDGTIQHVMSGVNPQGCEVASFKTPSEEELNHDFLWRHTKALPERGKIGIFNRSYYEDVLIVKVRPEVFEKQKLPQQLEGKKFWDQRYEDINMFERHLVRNGTVILKFFLHVSKEEQKVRLLKRLETHDKEWKFSLFDLSERSKWDDYVQAYEDVFNNTSTEWAPWYIIPADKKWVSHSLISEIIVSQIDKLDLKYPVLSKEQSEALKNAKAELEKE
ncbi:MAG TPA: polyphosphate kinase 2 family protein [Candidatus Acidoferrum sp.]|nr:polyphosphate kinase 2 family protein [Candidatus Acidoferrum sp.]